jgi:alpha-beta hydrolase superfamily lysophospholipase
MSMRGAYLDAEGESFLALLHEPAADAPRRQTAVLIVPPLGWDEVASYRPRRDWAEALAAYGHPTARIDLPGTGDSAGGPSDPDRVAAWTRAVVVAVEWLRLAGGLPRVAVVGLGAGGLLALAAQDAGAGADDLVLWGVPARGKAFVRQLEAFGQMEATQLGAPTGAPGGGLAAGGFALTAETVGALRSLEARALEATGAQRALVLGRDGVAPDRALVDHLRGQGVDVTTDPGRGHGAMHAEPHEAEAPVEVIDLLLDWLASGVLPATARAPVALEELEAADVGSGRERPLTIEQPFGSLYGIVTEPHGEPAGITVVLLNSGAIRRSGPNRMWVEAARRWAAEGVTTLRLDVQGIGDAGGAPARDADVTLYVPEFVDQVRSALDAAQQQGLPARFVLGGLCSGAYWAFHVALDDPRAVAALMLNPRLLVWDEALVQQRAQRRALRRPKLRSWRRLLRGHIGPRWFLARGRELLSALRRRPTLSPGDALERAVARVEAATGTRFLLAFSGEEPLRDELTADGTLPRLETLEHVRVTSLPGHDHTLRSIVAQRAAHEVLDGAVRAEIAAVRDA